MRRGRARRNVAGIVTAGDEDLYQVYDRSTRLWDVIDPSIGEVIKSKKGAWKNIRKGKDG